MRFFLDHDVPGDIALLLRYWKHEATVLREVLPVATTDEDAFGYARTHGLITITCNRADYLALAANHPDHPGLIILVRRRSRQTETSRLLMLLKNAGKQGLANNVNFAGTHRSCRGRDGCQRRATGPRRYRRSIVRSADC